MNWCRWQRLPLFAIVFAAVSSMTACSTPTPVDGASETRSIQRLAVFYGRFAAYHKGKPPANEAEFKKFVETLPKEDLAAMKWDTVNVAANFTSPRDQQPYVIRYGLKQTLMGPPDQMPVVIYEKTGVNGKRLIALSMGKVDEVDDAKFRELVPDAK